MSGSGTQKKCLARVYTRERDTLTKLKNSGVFRSFLVIPLFLVLGIFPVLRQSI